MASDIATLFRRLTLGVYVVGVAHRERRDAFTAAYVMQASYEPLLLALAVNRGHASYPVLVAGQTFSVNVLKREQIELARHFGTRSGRDVDKLTGIAWRPGSMGAPILEEALAYFDCQVTESMPAGGHQLVLGHVVDGRIVDSQAVPLAYAETGDMDRSSALYPQVFQRRAE